VFGPYLQMKAQLGALGGRAPILLAVGDLGWGGRSYPGTVTTALALVAIADRLRRRRTEADDPRLAYAVAGLLAAAIAIDRVPLPFGAALPSPYALATRIVPGLDAIRVPAAISRGFALVATFLAGWGLAIVLRGRAARARLAIAAIVAAAALAEVFVPPIAARDFGAPVTMAAHDVRPPDDVIRLYERLPEGPVLDLPFAFDGRGILHQMPHYVLLAAYHGRPVAACYNSFLVQVQYDVAALATRVPDRDAVASLAALGFRSVMVHEELLGRAERRLVPLTANAAALHPPDPAASGLTLVASAASHTAYVVADPGPVTTDVAALAVVDTPNATTTIAAAPPSADVNVIFRNGAAETYRHPFPIEPTPVLVRWYGDGELRAESRVRALLPLALASGQTMLRKLTLPVTVAPGEYDVTLAPATSPDVVLARLRLRVAAASQA